MPQLTISHLLVAGVPLAWLLPNHYLPWPSGWLDGLALTLLALAALTSSSRTALALPWLAFCGLVIASVAVQSATGLILFGGDAWMVILYLLAFLLALLLGATLPGQGAPASGSGGGALDALALVMLSCAVLSVGIALAQWSGAVTLGLYGVELPPGARPTGNLAQPNHLATVAFLGLCAAALLRQSGRLGPASWWLVGCWMLLGLLLSGSRTGWLQIVWLIALMVALARRAPGRVRPVELLLLGAMFAVAVLSWPALNELLLMSPGRSHAEQMTGGTRWSHWTVLLDAAGRSPWLGWGWQQVSLAQQAAVLDHPFAHEHIEHSHNLVFDLVLWTGIPLGLLLVGLASWGVLRPLVHCRDGRLSWLLAAAGGLLVHAMFEYPLSYAYFLIPLGLLLGAAGAMTAGGRVVIVRAALTRSVAALCAVLLGWTAVEYLSAESNHRLLRLELARIGTSKVESTAPELKLLTQLEAFLRFARTPARPGMSTEEIDWMHQVSMRFAYAPSLLRFALVAGLNGRPAQAELTLRRLCATHPLARCEEVREAWANAQRRWPVLLEIAVP